MPPASNNVCVTADLNASKDNSFRAMNCLLADGCSPVTRGDPCRPASPRSPRPGAGAWGPCRGRSIPSSRGSASSVPGVGRALPALSVGEGPRAPQRPAASPSPSAGGGAAGKAERGGGEMPAPRRPQLCRLLAPSSPKSRGARALIWSSDCPRVCAHVDVCARIGSGI